MSSEQPHRILTSLEKPRVFWAVTICLLALLGTVMVHVAQLESATYDEPLYLATGLEYWKTGNFWRNVEHPPLSKLLAALPLLRLDLRLATESAEFRNGRPHRLFLYSNRETPARILFHGRLPFIILAVLFGLALVLWTRSRFGAAAALAALAFYVLDPTIISHGHYAANDFIAAVFVFLTCIAWERFLRAGNWWAAGLVGILLGLALASKHSTILLIGMLPLLYLVHRLVSARSQPLRRVIASGAVAAMLAIGVVGLCYGSETKRALRPNSPPAQDGLDRSLVSGRVFAWAGEHLGLPAHAFLTGITIQENHNREGHEAYLMGEVSHGGWWYYFPLAFLWKTPLSVLAGILAVFGFAAAGLRKHGWRELRRIRFEWILLASLPAFILGVSMTANINIGQRYLLGVYPFLYVLIAAALIHLRAHRTALLLVVLLAAENIAVAPHYLTYFSPLFGGSGSAPKYLVDSNLDWGQDLLKLRKYLDSVSSDRTCLTYFGAADVDYHGFGRHDVPQNEARAGRADCMSAVSATYLYSLEEGEAYRWLREREPLAKVGNTIYVYDLRTSRETQ